MSDQVSDESKLNADSSILSKKGYVKDSLKLIREKKERLKDAMKSISETEKPDLELMSKLLSAFDSMTAQENQYLEVMKSIVTIHEHAVEDVSQDIAASKAQAQSMPDIQLIPHSDKPAENPATDEDMKELVETLKEIHEVSKQTALAAQVNEQLQQKLNLHKAKKATLQEIRRDKAKELQQKSNETLTTVELTRLKLENERNSKKHLEKELERLRKAALQKGIELGIVEDQMKDAAIRAISHLTDEAHRIPPTTDETAEDREEKPELTEEQKMEDRRRQIRENVQKERDRKEQVNQQIREKLKAFEARKERVRQLREMLEHTNNEALKELQAENEKARLASEQSAETVSTSETSSEVKTSAAVEQQPVVEAAPIDVPTIVDNVAKVVEEDQKAVETEALLPKIEDNNKEIAEVKELSASDFDNMTEEERKEFEDAEDELNKTIRNATMNLQNLTLMRMRLEDLQNRGEELTEDEARFIEGLDASLPSTLDNIDVEEVTDEPPPPPTTSPPASPINTEIEDVVRQKFVSAIKLKSAKSLLASYCADESIENERKALITTLQLDRMEVLLRQQMKDIGEIREMVCPAASSLSITKSALLRASSSLLNSLADVLSQMASGQHTSARELDNILQQLYHIDNTTVISNSLNQEVQNDSAILPRKGLLVRSQTLESFKKDPYQSNNVEKKSCMVKQKTTESVRFASDVQDEMCETKFYEVSPLSLTSSASSEDGSHGGFVLHAADGGFDGGSGPSSPEPIEVTSIIRQGVKEDNCKHIVLEEKKPTLSRGLTFRNDAVVEDNEEISRIVDTIIRILSSELRTASVLTRDICQSLLDLIITLASQHFRRVPLDLLQSQLGSIVSDTINPYLELSMIENRKQFLRELSSILLNELSFFHVLDSVQAIPDKNK